MHLRFVAHIWHAWTHLGVTLPQSGFWLVAHIVYSQSATCAWPHSPQTLTSCQPSSAASPPKFPLQQAELPELQSRAASSRPCVPVFLHLQSRLASEASVVQSSASTAVSWEVMMPMLKLCSHQTDHCWPQTSHSLNHLTLVPWLFSPVAWHSCDWYDPRICSKYSVARADTPWQCDPQSCSTHSCGRRVGDNQQHDVPYPGIGSTLLQLLPLQRSDCYPKDEVRSEPEPECWMLIAETLKSLTCDEVIMRTQEWGTTKIKQTCGKLRNHQLWQLTSRHCTVFSDSLASWYASPNAHCNFS